MAETAIAQLVLRERQSRVRGLVEQMRECYHPDATVVTSWLQGNAEDYLAGAKARDQIPVPIINRVAPPVVYLQGRRAVVELPSTTTRWIPITGVEAELASFMRLIYRVEARDDVWKISALTTVNEGDTLRAAVPGTVLAVDAEQLARFRHSYRFLAYSRWLDGESVSDDLYGIDQPEVLDALYAQEFTWLRPDGDING